MQTGQGGRVLIADDHPLTREGLGLAVRAAFPGVTVDTAGSVEEAVRALGTHRGYRLVLLDFILPDARGFSGLMRLQHEAASIPIVMISAREEAALVDAARALGASGFLYKTRPLDSLVEALREIAQGRVVFPPVSAQGLSAGLRDKVGTLSGAQLKVLLALADGRLNKQIANDLDVSEATVKAHLTAVFRKLGVNNRAQALLMVQPLLGEFGAVEGG